MIGSTESRSSISGDGASTITALAIAALVSGELIGDGTISVSGVAPLDRAGPRHLSILASGKYAPMMATTKAGVVLVDPEFRDAAGAPPARIIVTQPLEKLLSLLPKLYPLESLIPGVASTARIGKGASLGRGVSIGEYAIIGASAKLGDGVVIGPHSVIGDRVLIGEKTRLWPGVTIYSGATLGARTMIHSGARIGCDGFGYVFQGGAHQKIQHVGGCIIGDDVEIGANTTIDRGSIDDTVIGNGTKIDNLVHVAHNVRIGEKCLLMAQVGVAGSVTIGDGAILAGQAGISGHLSIGAGARLAAQAGVFGDIPAGESWSGYPARPHRESLRASAALFKLAGMMRRLEKLLGEGESDSR
ncbi:MAG TPA: UDP-3-O-(3-hydroxymyristoyl)glucosamine N-acyltransferase [Gemmatimonadaceae bacterium]|nr:UDP-3-O-(3-hydroxymyristoyl)glucosamine N-acyltransferase [Gemmatimonadaceae bacterium]